MKIIKEYKNYRIISALSNWFDFNRNEYYYIQELKYKKSFFGRINLGNILMKIFLSPIFGPQISLLKS